jgi:hypothetical protein
VTPVVPPCQRLIGATLRRYREDAGLGLLDAARTLGCDWSQVSRIEAGECGIRLAEMRDLLSGYGADKAGRDFLEALARAACDGWWSSYRRVLPAGYTGMLAAESVATHITVYAPLQVPGLLHTEGYARAIALAGHHDSGEIADAAVAATAARQRAVLHERGTTIAVILGEAALRQEVGGAGVLRGQLRYLAAAVGGSPGPRSRCCRSRPGHTGRTAGSRSCTSARRCRPAWSWWTACPMPGSTWMPRTPSPPAPARSPGLQELALSPRDSAQMLKEAAHD